MRIRTGYEVIAGLPTAAASWLYPANAHIPYGPINAILTAFYNKDTGPLPIPGEYPYFYIVRDEFQRQIGLLIGDIRNVDRDGRTSGVELNENDKRNLFVSSLAEAAKFPQPVPWAPGDWPYRMFWAEAYGLAGVEWRMLPGQVFPADCFNAILAGLYGINVQPVLYPVYNPNHPSGTVPQIGVLLSQLRVAVNLDSDAQLALQDFGYLMTHPTDVPWGQMEYDCV